MTTMSAAERTSGGRSGGDGDVFDDVMQRAGGAELARDEIEGVNAEGRAFERSVGAKPFGHGRCGVGCATGESDVRVEGADVEVETEIEEGVVELLTELMQAWVALTESGPEHAGRSAFGGEGADPFDGEDERLDLDGGETFDDRGKAAVVDIADEAEGDVKLV